MQLIQLTLADGFTGHWLCGISMNLSLSRLVLSGTCTLVQHEGFCCLFISWLKRGFDSINWIIKKIWFEFLMLFAFAENAFKTRAIHHSMSTNHQVLTMYIYSKETLIATPPLSNTIKQNELIIQSKSQWKPLSNRLSHTRSINRKITLIRSHSIRHDNSPFSRLAWASH